MSFADYRLSKIYTVSSLLCILSAIMLIIIGGSVAFTLACMLFLSSGYLHARAIMESDLEAFEQALVNGEIEENAGEMPENVVDLESLSESDREVIQRVFGFEFETDEEETKND
jgi:hypothetical protein